MACERFGDGLIGQPAGTVTAVALVLAGLLILAASGRSSAAGPRWTYGLLVVAAGVGSVIQHGPHPPWQAYAHDLSLAAVLGFVAADAVADLTGRRARAYWWLVPTAALVPVIAIGPLLSSVAQGGLAAVAIGLSLLRARVRPRLRRTLLVALAILAAGAAVGTLGERTALCRPDSLWQGHAAWHLLAASALWWLAPVIGARAPEAL